MRIVRALAALAVSVVAISMAPNGAAQQRPPNPGPAGPKDAKAVQTPCELRIGDAPIRAIVSGADLQNLALNNAATPGCAKPEDVKSRVAWLRDVSDSNRRWEAAIREVGGVVFLELRGAAPATGGPRKFELGRDDTVLANLTIAVSSLPAAAPGPLDVSYEDSALNVVQTGRSRVDVKTGKPIAVAGGGVWNTATMSFPTEVPSSSLYDRGPVVNGGPSHFEWDIKSISARHPMIGVPKKTAEGSGMMPRSPGEVVGVGVIPFRTPQEQSGPVSAELNLTWKVRKLSNQDEWDVAAPILAFRTQLASSVADETLPMDLRPVAQVECKDNAVAPRDIARHNETVGVDKTAAQNGQCRLVVDLCNEDSERLVQRGPQRYRVRVRKDDRETSEEVVLPFPRRLAVARKLDPKGREGVTASNENLSIRIAKADNDAKNKEEGSAERAHLEALTLEAEWKGAFGRRPECRSIHYLALPGATETTDGLYLVSVTPAPESDVYVRRDSVKKEDNPFEARIRMRGLYGFDTGIRAFVTVPINLLGVRLPANAPELASSNDNRLAQITTISTGILLGFEPWDYRFGRSSLPIPMRPQAGFHVVDLLERRRGIAALAGITTTVPALDVADTVSANLGVFYENDLREDHPLLNGHRLLFTTSVNFLASPSKADAKK